MTYNKIVFHLEVTLTLSIIGDSYVSISERCLCLPHGHPGKQFFGMFLSTKLPVISAPISEEPVKCQDVYFPKLKTEQVKAVKIKLEPFYTEDPESWFSHLEVQLSATSRLERS